MRKLFKLIFQEAVIAIIILMVISMISFLPYYFFRNSKYNREIELRREVEKLKKLDTEDMACIKEELFIKKNDKLINQYKECEFYNNQLYLVEKNGNLIRIGIYQ